MSYQPHEKAKYYLVNGKHVFWHMLIQMACNEGMEPDPILTTSQAARYLRSLGYTVEEDREN